MKAIEYTEYGSPDVLHLSDVANPTPAADEVLIKVHAATVTTGDVNARGFTFVPRGFGPLPRLMLGIRRPKRRVLGTEVSGEVVAVGDDVQRFEVGDQVFGIGSETFGAYAEYVCRRAEGALVTKPANLSYEEAAAIPFGAGTALYFLRDKANIQPGQKVLIIGASGGVGSYAVQLASHFGAEVTGVCSSKNLELVKSLGADHVIDYTKEDFTQSEEKYDIIFDTVGKSSFSKCKHNLTRSGVYLSGPSGPGAFLQMAWTSIVGSRKVLAGTPAEKKEPLAFLKGLAEAGKIKPLIDRRYSLAQTAEAHRYVDEGHKRGNVVIHVVPNGSG